MNRANAHTHAAGTAIARLARNITTKTVQGQIAGKPALLLINPQLTVDKGAFFFFALWDDEKLPAASNA